MKKYFLFALAAIVSLVFAACSEEVLSDSQSEEMVDVVYTINTQSQANTRATHDGDGAAANVNRFICEVWHVGTNDALSLYKREVKTVDTGTTSTNFNLRLVASQNYKVLFWADCADTSGDDLYYTTNTDKGLQEIAIKKNAEDKYVGNNDALDAFFAVESIEKENLKGILTKTVYLKRPFAQLNVITTDIDDIKESSMADDMVPNKVEMTVNAPTKFSMLEGLISEPQDIEYTANVYYSQYAEGASDYDYGYCTLAMNYFFAPANEQAVETVEFVAINGSTELASLEFANIPLQRNYRTNIIGDLLTDAVNYTVTIVPTWNTPENDVYWTKVATVGDIAAAFAAGKTNVEVLDAPTSDVAIEIPKKHEENNNVSVGIKLPATTVSVAIKYDSSNDHAPANVNVEIPNSSGNVTIVCPNSHVTLNGGVYSTVTASTSSSTLVIEKDVTIANLTITEGGVEIHGTVNALTVSPASGKKVEFRACEGLSGEVYNALKDFIDPRYIAVENETTPQTYDIVLNVVAEINDVSYASIADAITDAKTGDIIKLCKDVDRVPMMSSSEQYGDIAFYIDGKVITLDLNGYNVKVPMSDPESGVCFWGAHAGKITIIDSSDSKSSTFDYGGKDIAVNNSLMILNGLYNFETTSSYCQVGDEPVKAGERWTVRPIFDKGAGSQADPFIVNTKEQFLKLQSVDLRNYNLNGSNTRVYFKVNTDLVFTESVGESSYSYCIIPQLVNSEIDFAKGNGENHTVTLPEEVCLLGNVFGGCLKNVSVNLNEESIVSYIAGPFEFNNVCTSGQVTPSNNTGAYVTYVQGTHVSFTDCISNVEMSGLGGAGNYNSVFVGYVFSGTVNLDFTNCVNKGSLVCGKASMFIGNPNAATIELNVTNCVNEGTIKATYMDDDYNFNYYFSTSSNNYKFVLNGVEYNDNNSLPTSYMPNVLEDNCVINRGVVENGPENTGLVLSRNEDKTFTITPATGNEVGGKAVDHYTVGLGLYTGISNGSCLFFATETISSDGSTSYTTTLKDYKFVDISFVNGDEMGELAGNRTFTKDGETYYVVLDDETVRGEHGAAPAQMYYLSAFDGNNKLLASVSLSDTQQSSRSMRSSTISTFRYSGTVKERQVPTTKVSIVE